MDEIIKKLDNFEILALKGAGGKGGGGGGTEITDGIVVTARDADGYPIEAELYCSDGIIHVQSFGNARDAGYYNGYKWDRLQKLTLKNRIIRIDSGAFTNCRNLTSIVSDIDDNPFEYVETFDNGSQWAMVFAGCGVSGNLVFPLLHNTYSQVYTFYGCSNITGLSCPEVNGLHQGFVQECTNLRTLYLPKCTRVRGDSRYCFGNCIALETVQLGSVGYACSIDYPYNPFSGCTQSGLTITLFCTPANADYQLSYIRNGATHATIIIKDSTTGETIVTSTP